MYARHFFGARYFGPRYWGDGGNETPIVVVQESFSGGWEPRRRTRKDIQEGRRKVGIPELPEEQEIRAEEAVVQAVEAASTLARAKPETQAASDALESQRRAEQLYLDVYLAVYPQLQEARILENFRLEAIQRARELEEEAFSILLLSL